MRCLYDGDHPCGKCPACLANRQRAFMFRLDQEKDTSKFYFWLTLQYSDECVPRFPSGEMCFSKEHCREFFEKLRKRYAKYGNTFKHFLVCEYGPNETHRPHYHLLLMIYNNKSAAENYVIRREMRDFILHDCWKHGHVTEKAFHGRVLRYLTKYCCKPELTGDFHTMQPFTLISRGIGLSLLDRITPEHKQQMIERLDFVYSYNGGKIQLPRYYVDKILPHSLEEVRKATIAEDWDKVDRLNDIRSRLSDKQNLIYKKTHHEKIDIESYDFESFINFDHRVKESRDYQFQIFRSKIRQRKNL